MKSMRGWAFLLCVLSGGCGEGDLQVSLQHALGLDDCDENPTKCGRGLITMERIEAAQREAACPGRDDDQRDDCLEETAKESGDPSYCEKMTPTKVDRCLSDVATKLNDPRICAKVIDDKPKERCYENSGKGNPYACLGVEDVEERDRCLEVGLTNRLGSDLPPLTPELCDAFHSEQKKRECKFVGAGLWGLDEFCKNIGSEEAATRCKELAHPSDSEVRSCASAKKGNVQSPWLDGKFRTECVIRQASSKLGRCLSLGDGTAMKCLQDLALFSRGPEQECAPLEGKDKDQCFMAYGVLLQQPEMCKQVSDFGQGDCARTMTRHLRHAESCGQLPENEANQCLLRNIPYVVDPKVCVKLHREHDRERCIRSALMKR